MPGGGDGQWSNDRLETTYAEARAVLEAQNATMSDIDAKAMQTVRFNTILIGILLAAVNAAEATIFDPDWFGFSVAALTISAVLGLATYNESDLFVGASGGYIDTLVQDETEDPWDEDILKTFAGMISKNSDDIDWNSALLTLTQLSLAVGVIAAIVSIVI